jgi:hypothetical protein
MDGFIFCALTKNKPIFKPNTKRIFQIYQRLALARSPGKGATALA